MSKVDKVDNKAHLTNHVLHVTVICGNEKLEW